MYGSPEHIRKVIEKGGESYLQSFGLDWEFLVGKKILDAGAAQGEFAAAAKLHGVDAVSLEKSYQVFFEKNVSDQADYVAGDIYHIPFKDETFDIVFARYLIPYGSKENVATYIKEVGRVLKPGGELRIIPAPFKDNKGEEIPLDFIKSLGLSVESFSCGGDTFRYRGVSEKGYVFKNNL